MPSLPFTAHPLPPIHSTRAFDRRQRAVASAELARDADHSRAVALTLQRYELARACYAASEVDGAAAGGTVSSAHKHARPDPLRRETLWSLDVHCVSEQGMRRKLERLVQARLTEIAFDCF